MRKSRKLHFILIASVAAVAAAAALAVSVAYRWQRAGTAEEATLAKVRKGEFLVVVRCRGELRARRSTQVIAPYNVPDLRIVWMAPSGSQVSAEDVVIRFDPSSAQRQLQEKETALEQAQAKLDEAVAQARITAEQDKRDFAEARYNVERAQLEASKQEIVSALQGEQARINLGLSEKSLATREARVALHETAERAKIASLERARAQAEYEVDLTRSRLERMELKTPGSGVIIFSTNNSNISTYSNRVPYKIGDQVFGGTTLAEIPDLSTLEVEAKLEEIDRGRISPGNDVRIRVDALPELTVPAKLMEISALTQLNMEWPMISTFRVFASIEKADPRFRPGMNATMDIIVERIPDAISVPARALFTLDGEPVVYVAENGGYRLEHVRVLARNPDEAAVSGIPEGVMVSLREPALEEE